MKLVDAYIRLASKAQPSLKIGRQLDLDELYSHFGIDSDPYFKASKVVQDFLIGQMELRLSTTGQPNELSGFDLKRLRNHLALSHFIGDLPSANVMQPLETLFSVGALADNVPPFESEDIWVQAISLAKDYAIIAPKSLGNGISMQVTYCRQYAVSQGINYFRKQGYEISIGDAKPVVEEVDLRKIAESLEEDVKGLGGAWFVKSIFDGNKELYDASMQRVHFARRYEPIPTVENCTPGIPDGYLLNLAVKHSQRPPELLKPDERNVALKRVIEASRHFAALYDVQNYYQLSVLLQSTNSIVDFVQDTALYDSFFIPIQLRPSDMPDIILGLFSWVNRDNMREKLGFDLDDYVSTLIASKGSVELSKHNSEQGSLHLNEEALVGTSLKPLRTHTFKLTVYSLDTFTVTLEPEELGQGVLLAHIFTTGGYELHTCFCQQGNFVVFTVIGFVSVDA